MAEQRKAREYLRVSYDRSGRERSQDEQHDENAAAAAAHGLTLGRPYRENGSRSASRYGTKVRDAFAELLADLRKGRFGADVLILWESSRGSRKVGEWVELIDLCEQRSVLIHVTTHQRTYDPANARDRRSLLEDAVDSEYESAKTSQRQRRAAAANAAAGKPHGPAPYGYVRRYDPVTRKLVAQEPDPVEAPVVREVYARLLAGHSLRAISRDLEARGVRNDSGTPFSAQHLRDMVLRPAYAGLRSHHQDRTERRARPLNGAVKGTWPALVDQATYFAVRRLLTAPERKTVRSGRARHLLSMIARCDVCGGPLAATRRHAAPEYQCHLKGCVRIDQASLDALAEAIMLGYLARDDIYESLRAAGRDGDDAELANARDELAAATAELDELRATVAAGRLSVASLAAVEPGLLARVAEAEERERELSTPPALAGLISPGRDVARRWKAAPMSTRREVARILLGPDLLGELRVARRPEGRRNVHVPAPERVVWRRGPS
jgi:DNA invertase Pin-like site-specific DNA recombinase